jgi:mRNA interferase HigB
MRVISLKTLQKFWSKNHDAKQHLLAWHDEVSQAHWKNPEEIKERYTTASILKNRRVVFNIKGNQYRLIVGVAY